MTALPPVGAFLKNFRRQFEPALKRYLDEAISNLRRVNPQGAELGNVIRNFTTRSGKRMRAALVLLGYELAGGKPTRRILQPAIAVELLHSFLLIHDDIIDQSPLRRGKPTVHERFAQRYGNMFALRAGTSKNLGSSLAIITGDLCFSFALAALLESEFPDDRISAASAYFLRATDATIVGQTLDMILPLKRRVSEREALSVLRLKTANYSVFAPLALGMIIAGARPQLLKQIERYAIPVGVAFQVQDDILGVFGSEQELGKPITSDLEEGKQTLLVVYARERATPAQRRRLDAIVGKKSLSGSELREAREILRSTGAVERCQGLGRALVAGAQRSLLNLRLPASPKKLLHELASYVMDRTT